MLTFRCAVISKYAACQTLYFGEIQHFQRQVFENPEKFKSNLLTGPLKNMIFKGRRTILRESFPKIHSIMEVSFRETVPLY